MRITSRMIIYFHEGIDSLIHIFKYFDSKEINFSKFISLEIIELLFNDIELLILLYTNHYQVKFLFN